MSLAMTLSSRASASWGGSGSRRDLAPTPGWRLPVERYAAFIAMVDSARRGQMSGGRGIGWCLRETISEQTHSARP